MRRYLCLLLILPTINLFSAVKLPVLINSDEEIFLSIAEMLEKELPKNIEILVYEPHIFDDKEGITPRMLENYKLILSSQQLVRDFKLHFIEDVIRANEKITRRMIDIANEDELVGVAALLELDAVLMANITIFHGRQRSVWDRSTRKWVKKNIALIQGNVFISDNKALVIRFAYYFLID